MSTEHLLFILVSYRVTTLICLDKVLGMHGQMVSNGQEIQWVEGTRLRRFVDKVLLKKSGLPRNGFTRFFFELYKCPDYCTSFWVSAVFAAFLPGNYFLNLFAVAGGTTLCFKLQH